jgi:hypothetical protein
MWGIAHRIFGFAHRTLVLTSRTFNHLKFTSSAEFLPGQGVHFHGAAWARNSSGNLEQALTLERHHEGVGTIFMPNDAPELRTRAAL